MLRKSDAAKLRVTIIQAGGMGGYGRNVNQMAGRAGSMAGSVAGAAAGNAVGRVGKLLK